MASKPIQLGFCVVLVAAFLVAPAAAADDGGGGGILQAITDFLFGWLTPPAETPASEEAPENQAAEIPGTDLTPEPTVPPEPTVTPEANATVTPTPTPRTLGTVYAVDYHTAPPYGSAPFMVRFTAAPDEDIEYTHWQFGDGFSSTERDHWHTYEAAGTYTATLTVGNSTWNQTAEILIEVEPPGVVPLPTDEEMMV